MEKTGQEGLWGKRKKRITYLGSWRRSSREAGQGRGLYQPNDPVTQGLGDTVKRGTTREATPRVRKRYFSEPYILYHTILKNQHYTISPVIVIIIFIQ